MGTIRTGTSRPFPAKGRPFEPLDAGQMAERNLERAKRAARERLEARRAMAVRAAESLPDAYRGLSVSRPEVRAWADAYLSGERRNLVLKGPVGSHKTSEACALVSDLAGHGVMCRFDTAVGHLRWLRDAFDDGAGEAERMSALCGADVLVIDDIGGEKPTEWAVQAIRDLLDRRFASMRPVVATTNYAAGELAERYGGTDGRAIVSRLYGSASKGQRALTVAFDGKDGRIHG